MVNEYGSSPATMRPHPVIQSDVLDEDGNLLAADIGITWECVRVVGSGPPRPGMGPVISTPYQPTQEHDRENTSTTAQPPTPLTVPDAEIQLRRPPQEIRQGYRPAAPIQRFNNKSLNWPVWFRHFQGNRPFADQNRGFRSQTRTGRDYSKVKCFSCGQFGHMQSRCPRPDVSLPFKPVGWYLQSDSRQQRDGDNQPGNSP